MGLSKGATYFISNSARNAARAGNQIFRFTVVSRLFHAEWTSAHAASLQPDETKSARTVLSGTNRQYRTCTPAEFGDPNAECVPRSGQFSSGISNSLGFDDIGYGNDFSSYGRTPFGDGSIDTLGAPPGRPSRTANGTQPIYIQKEPPDEFQRYVADSIGQLLPIFGALLFEHVPATFAPIDRTPVSADYSISPGDVLQIAVWGQLNLTRRFGVGRTGEMILPDAGPVSVAGMSYIQAASVVKARLSQLYKNFDVSVSLAQLHSVQVFVVGNARRPGSYTVSSLSTLVNTLFASGGPSSRGSMRAIQLRRGDRTVQTFDLYQLLVNGDNSQDAQLSPGDVILIPPAGPRVAIAGSVGHPGIYEIKAGTTLEEALQLADGVSPLAALNQVVLERINDAGGLALEHLSMRAADLRVTLQTATLFVFCRLCRTSRMPSRSAEMLPTLGAFRGKRRCASAT